MKEGWSHGLRDIEGTFTGLLSDDSMTLFDGATGTMVYFYGPDPNLPWWKHHFYRLRERLRGTPYPEVVIASGPLGPVTTEVSEDGTVISGTFTAAGKWDIK